MYVAYRLLWFNITKYTPICLIRQDNETVLATPKYGPYIPGCPPPSPSDLRHTL